VVDSSVNPEVERRPARYFAKWFAVSAALAGLVMGIAMALYTTHGVRGIDGLPIERVTIVEYTDNGEGGCGRGSDEVDLKIESSNPPQGQPAVFWVRDQCVPALSKGDRIPLAREVEDGKVVRYWIDPTLTYAAAAWTSVGTLIMVFAIVFAVCWLGLGFRRLWLRFFWHD